MKTLCLLFVFLGSGLAWAQDAEILGRVSAEGKTVAEARQKLEAAQRKLGAGSLVQIECYEAGIYRDGLSFNKRPAHCEAIALR